MNAVNLIPEDQRRGPSSGPGRSGAGVYVLLGALAVIVIAAAAYVLSTNSISERRGELAKTRLEATAATAEASVLKPYADFAALADTRVGTVRSLADSRFDWEKVMRDLSRAMPRTAWLSNFTGTVSPDVTLEGASASSGLRASIPVPAVVLSGCADSQDQVAHMMARMRLIDGVTRVSLDSSIKADVAKDSAGSAPADGGSGGDGGCAVKRGAPAFTIVLFFEDKVTAPAAPGGGTGTPGAPAQATAAASTTGTSTTGSTGGTTTGGTTGPAPAGSTTTTTGGTTAAPAAGSK